MAEGDIYEQLTTASESHKATDTRRTIVICHCRVRDFEHLATSQRMGSWVADSRGRVIGLTGLFDRGGSGEVEPVVVAEAARDQGIGRVLISRVVEEACARGYEYLAIRPAARNVAAVRRFHAAGFRTLGGHIDLTMDLAARRQEWLPGASLHGLDFDY